MSETFNAVGEGMEQPRLLEMKSNPTMRLTPQQKVLITLDLNGRPLTMKDLCTSTGLAWAQTNLIVKNMVKEALGVNEARPKTYFLKDEFKGPARLLRYAMQGLNIEEFTVGKAIDQRPEVFEEKEFREGMYKVMDLILKTVPAHDASEPAILNIEEDKCFESDNPKEHWFFCHGISTKLQSELGQERVKDWTKNCNEKGIGEIVVNDVSFSTPSLWKKMVPFESHEYWLTYEPIRPEGYIAFGDKVALLKWNAKRCILHTDGELAKVFRNNIKIMRLRSQIMIQCCRKHRQFIANSKTDIYEKMWKQN